MKFKFRESPLPIMGFKPHIEGQVMERTDRCSPGSEITLETIESEKIKVTDYLFDESTEKYNANYKGIAITFEHGQVQNCQKIYSPTKPPKSLEGTHLS
jgi:penicillin-binding protein-related factor A (putative recombinase)